MTEGLCCLCRFPVFEKEITQPIQRYCLSATISNSFIELQQFAVLLQGVVTATLSSVDTRDFSHRIGFGANLFGGSAQLQRTLVKGEGFVKVFHQPVYLADFRGRDRL